MRFQSKTVWILAFTLGLMGAGTLAPFAAAQDLKAELDALDDLPEDDLSGGAASQVGGSAATTVPDAANADSGPPAALATPSALSSSTASSAPRAAPSRELGVGDLDLQGLEQELNFDSFKDGGKVGLDQLQNAQKNSLGDEIKGKVTGLDFKQLQDRVRLVITSDRPIDWTRELRSKRRQVIVELRNMDIAREILKRALDTGEFEGPVALVQAFPAKVGGRDSVKILFQLRSFVDPTILRTGNDLVVDFPITGGDTLFRTKTASRVVVPRTYVSANDLKEFKGSPISINVKGAELGDFLNLISRSAGKNFVVSGNIGADKKITMNLVNVPWDQALSMALFNNQLGFQDLDTVIRIATVDELQKELDIARDSAKKAADLIPIETRLFRINYADVATLQGNISPFLTKERGNVTIEKRSSTLVVTDVPEVLEKIDRYIRAIDKQTPQVLIEARIVEANEHFNRDQAFHLTGAKGGFQIGNSNVSSATNTTGGNTGANTGITSGAGSSTNGGLQLRFGNLGSIGLVDAFLSFEESESHSRAISSPRVTVLANETANISQGNKTTVNITDSAGNTVKQEINIPTNLSVTPSVSSDGYVFMDVTINRDIPVDLSIPSIATRSAKTKLVVESGKTAVIGGIYQDTQIDQESGIPFLRKIPIFGNLFTTLRKRVKDTNELLIFISPRIINQELSGVQQTGKLGEGDFTASASVPGEAR